ncbi:zinc finger protein [Amycolatopsis palatopharyngis]|uniref:zinc finger protein n=1 Tax=Amycolatopsis palatopharyngis TaxID=187982 RepID=UPI000E27447E|nr:zinc finger protein [Amycolatopsis palatopharyngis]
MTLRWQQAERKRHALDMNPANRPRPGERFRALCGAEVTPTRLDFQELGGHWHAPTCWHCDHEWRVIEHFPANEIPPLPVGR